MYMGMKMAKHKYSAKRTNWSNYTSKCLELLKTCTHNDSSSVGTRTEEQTNQTGEPRNRLRRSQSVESDTALKKACVLIERCWVNGVTLFDENDMYLHSLPHITHKN